MRIPFLLAAVLLATSLFGQLPPDQKSDVLKKQMQAKRIESAPKIDGKLDDEIWLQVRPATDFVQQTPDPGSAPSRKTEVRILYDDNAIYLGALIYDDPDSISQVLTGRDGLNNADFFGIFIDAYQDGVNGNGFVVTPAGVQFDAKQSSQGEDDRWNAVWKSQTTITDDGWVVEMKIPFSALRFPKTEVQTWNINFLRRINRNGERLWWSELKPDVNGFYNQAGEMSGIDNIKSPFRLFLYPYFSTAVAHVPTGDPDISNWGREFNAGMDIKYGINDAFTLDMTLIPDFGQARSDNEVLNLSPFEVRFDENRQFFTEGTELFSKADLFYSRRVGGTPIRYYDVEDFLEEDEEIKENPKESQLYNSTKVSGRTTSGLGIGVFNAISAETSATIEKSDDASIQRKIKTSPLTNYNVFVLDQSLKNNSFISFINTNVWREGGEDFAYEANTTAGLFNIQDKENTYELSGGLGVSQKYFDNFNDTELGFVYDIQWQKISGQFQYGFWHDTKSDKFDPNDLGFSSRFNVQAWGGRVNYNFYEPRGIVRQQFNGLNINYRRQYKPNRFKEIHINAFTNWGFTNFWQAETWFFLSPFIGNDFDEARSNGQVFLRPRDLTVGGFFRTDDRKKIVGRFNTRAATYFETGSNTWQVGAQPRFQLSDRLNLSLDLYFQRDNNVRGYAETADNDDVIIGTRTVRSSTNILSGSYIFNNKMSLTLRARHYWLAAEYHKYHRLMQDGNFEDLPNFDKYDDEGIPKHDISFNAFTVDMVYTWQFLPGSELSLVWKNAIFTDSPFADKRYLYNLGDTFKADQNNNISLKILFFLDALYFKKKQA